MKLDQFRKNSFLMTMRIIRQKEQRLKWLLDLGIRADKVINFGCSAGMDTLALMYCFDSRKGVGLDIDTSSIDEAQSNYRNIHENIQYFEDMIRLYHHIVFEDDKLWWEKVPVFFKKMLHDTFSLEYIVQDVTQPSSLLSNNFDIAWEQ